MATVEAEIRRDIEVYERVQLFLDDEISCC